MMKPDAHNLLLLLFLSAFVFQATATLEGDKVRHHKKGHHGHIGHHGQKKKNVDLHVQPLQVSPMDPKVDPKATLESECRQVSWPDTCINATLPYLAGYTGPIDHKAMALFSINVSIIGAQVLRDNATRTFNNSNLDKDHFSLFQTGLGHLDSGMNNLVNARDALTGTQPDFQKAIDNANEAYNQFVDTSRNFPVPYGENLKFHLEMAWVIQDFIYKTFNKTKPEPEYPDD